MAPVQSLPGEPWRFLAEDEMARRAGSNDKFSFLSSAFWQALPGASKTGRPLHWRAASWQEEFENADYRTPCSAQKVQSGQRKKGEVARSVRPVSRSKRTLHTWTYLTKELRTQPGEVQVLPGFITEGTGRNEIAE